MAVKSKEGCGAETPYMWFDLGVDAVVYDTTRTEEVEFSEVNEDRWYYRESAWLLDEGAPARRENFAKFTNAWAHPDT